MNTEITKSPEVAQEEMVTIEGPGPMSPIPGHIDWSRPLRTKGGLEAVRIIAIDHSLTKPVIGVILDSCLSKQVQTWSYNGEFCSAAGEFLDLENVPLNPKEG